MRNLFLGSREKHTWFDYGLDLLFIILIFAMGDRKFAYFLLFLTIADIAVMALLPDIEDKWWYKLLTGVIAIIVLLYVGISLLGIMRDIGVNLPL